MTLATPTPAEIGRALRISVEVHVLRVMSGLGARDGVYAFMSRIEDASGLSDMVTNAAVSDLIAAEQVAQQRFEANMIGFTLTPAGATRAEEGGA